MNLKINLQLTNDEIEKGIEKTIKIKRLVNNKLIDSDGSQFKEEVIKFNIQPGTQFGSILRIKGKGNESLDEGTTGDLLISLKEKKNDEEKTKESLRLWIVLSFLYSFLSQFIIESIHLKKVGESIHPTRFYFNDFDFLLFILIPLFFMSLSFSLGAIISLLKKNWKFIPTSILILKYIVSIACVIIVFFGKFSLK